MVKKFTQEINLKSKGVYLITHGSTDIKYVGSTITTFQERWRSHLNSIKREIGNRVLVNIYKKYGIEGFKFSILETMDNSSLEEIRTRERYWIMFYDTYNNGANCTLETSCAFKCFIRKPLTEEDKLKYMLSSPTRKKVYLYDVKGNLIYTFPSSVACDRFLGLKKGRTNWIINHPIRSIHKKYYPSYEEKIWNPEEEVFKQKSKAMLKVANSRKKNGTNLVSDCQKEKIRLSNPNRRRVALYDLNNNLIKEFNSFNECDDYLKLYRGTTSKVFRGLTQTLRKKYIPKLI